MDKFEAVVEHTREFQSENKEESKTETMKRSYVPTHYDIWIAGVAIVIGGQYYAWNLSFSAGFGSYLIAQVLMGSAYICLVCSLAEITSSVAFSGGAYGMARVILGFYPGFILASFEVLEYTFYTSMSAVWIGEFFCGKFHWDDSCQPLIWLVFYTICLITIFAGEAFYWSFNSLIGWTSLIILLIYCFGTLAVTNIENYSSLHKSEPISGIDNYFSGGMSAWMAVLPATTAGFGGVEALTLLTDLVKNPKTDLSYGMVASCCTLFVTMVFITFVAGSYFPGVQYTDDGYENFMNWGFQSMGISMNAAEWLIFPAQFAMAWGFVLPYGRLIHSMSRSNILPSCLCLMQQKTDHLAIIIGSIFSYILCLLSFYYPTISLTEIPILVSFVIYISDFYAFYRMNTDFSNIQREFRSPFGVAGAIYGSLVFMFGLISSIGFAENYWTILYVLGMFVLLSIYYLGFAHDAQIFSSEEQKSLVVLHVILFNKRKRMRMVKGNRGPGSKSSLLSAASEKKKKIEINSDCDIKEENKSFLNKILKDSQLELIENASNMSTTHEDDADDQRINSRHFDDNNSQRSISIKNNKILPEELSKHDHHLIVKNNKVNETQEPSLV